MLKANGSPRAIVVTDEERTFFRITIPCHEGAGNIIADIAKRDSSPISTNEGSPISSPISSPNTADAIIAMIKENPNISTSMMAGKLGISKRAVIKHTNQLQLDGKNKRNVLQGVVLGRLSTDSSLIKLQNNSTLFIPLIRNLLINKDCYLRGGE